MIKRVKEILLVVMLLMQNEALGTLIDEARAFSESLMKQQGLPFSESEINQRFEQNFPKAGGSIENKGIQETLEEARSSYEEHGDRGLKDSDPIAHQLSGMTARASAEETKDTKDLSLTQKIKQIHHERNNWPIARDDIIFAGLEKVEKGSYKPEYADLPRPELTDLGSRKKSAEDKILKCREAAPGELRSCIKKRIVRLVKGPSVQKNVRTLLKITGVQYGEHLYGGLYGDIDIDYKNGSFMSIKNMFGHSLGEYRSFYYPSMDPLLLGDAGGEVIFDPNFYMAVVNPQNNTLYSKELRQIPNASNGYIAKFNLSANSGDILLSWNVTIPGKLVPAPEDAWVGCEELENLASHSVCEQMTSELQGLNESRMIPGFNTPLLRAHWEEQKSYICGVGSNAQGCQEPVLQGCEQIGSECAVKRGEFCIEYEQTYRCKARGFENDNALKFDINKIKFGLGLGEPTQDKYETSDFAEAMAYWAAVREMSSEMKDDLGGILGDPNNPSIFHGRCHQCRIKLGSFFHNCCQLKGLLRSFLGGCSVDEKQLAVKAVTDRRCHKVDGRYCAKKVLGVCIEQRESYCCYGSKLAKIIQEIAHEQLPGFGWGSAEEPNCGSLTSEQLSQIDFDTPFAREKLAEIIAEFQAKVQEKFERVQKQVEASGDIGTKAREAERKMSEHYGPDRPIRIPQREPGQPRMGH